jgi:FlaA1/EpsC-like NDP-sugar epimerase
MHPLFNYGYKTGLFDEDFLLNEQEIKKEIKNSSFLTVGGAGSIGQAVVKLIYSYNPRVLHVIDISENNMVELVRDLRSSSIDNRCDFKTFIIDVGSIEFEVFTENSKDKYDYVINLSAMKHVRSERDIYTLMRILQTNVINTKKLLEFNKQNRVKNFFSVSTDKAANPVNVMGASKRLMEILMFENRQCKTSSARFANVAFSDGSLLFGLSNRIEKSQAIVVPTNIKRYFISKEDAAKLCLMSVIMGADQEIYFSNLSPNKDLVAISDVILSYLSSLGFEPDVCLTENEAIEKSKKLDLKSKKWPCLFTNISTSGEKEYEVFFTSDDQMVSTNYKNVGILKYTKSSHKANDFVVNLIEYQKTKEWTKSHILDLINNTIDNFYHIETDKNLDQGM